MSSRRNMIIRTVGAIAGDVATGVAVASACIWIIETAALGLFLSFLIWLLGMVAALALSQFVIHPALSVALSERKLDLAVDAAFALADATGITGQQVTDALTRYGRSALSRLSSWSSAQKGRLRPV